MLERKDIGDRGEELRQSAGRGCPKPVDPAGLFLDCIKVKTPSMINTSTAIVPSAGINKWVLDTVRAAVQNALGDDVLLPEGREDEWAGLFCGNRRQAFATDLIKELKPLSPAFGRVLGIVDIPLSHPAVNHVFGLTDPGSRISVMSLYHFRMKGETPAKIAGRASKTAIHELGHSYGLVHCGDHKCVMFFSYNLSDTDYKESRFCKKCLEELSLLKSGICERKEV